MGGTSQTKRLLRKLHKTIPHTSRSSQLRAGNFVPFPRGWNLEKRSPSVAQPSRPCSDRCERPPRYHHPAQLTISSGETKGKYKWKFSRGHATLDSASQSLVRRPLHKSRHAPGDRGLRFAADDAATHNDDRNATRKKENTNVWGGKQVDALGSR